MNHEMIVLPGPLPSAACFEDLASIFDFRFSIVGVVVGVGVGVAGTLSYSCCLRLLQASGASS